MDKDWKTIDDFMQKNPSSGCRCITTPRKRRRNASARSQYPETYIVNESGRVLFRVQGAVDWSNPEVRSRIDQILAS